MSTMRVHGLQSKDTHTTRPNLSCILFRHLLIQKGLTNFQCHLLCHDEVASDLADANVLGECMQLRLCTKDQR